MQLLRFAGGMGDWTRVARGILSGLSGVQHVTSGRECREWRLDEVF